MSRNLSINILVFQEKPSSNESLCSGQIDPIAPCVPTAA